MEQLTHEQFVRILRSALHYLYDPVQLRSSPLVDLLNLADEFDTAAALRQTLTKAVATLRPGEDEPPQSHAWRIYDTLNLQYIRQFPQENVATQLGISGRQLRRERRVALEALAQVLRAHYSLPSSSISATHGDMIKPATDGDQTLSEELVWLTDGQPEQVTSVGEAVQTAVDLVQPLARQWTIPLQIDVQTDLAELPVAQLALRSILLTVLNLAIPRAGSGPIAISAMLAESELELTVTCLDTAMSTTSFLVEDAADLETAQNLAAYYGARLLLQQQKGTGFAFALTLPRPKQIPVLVIDDNADWLDLLQRYAADSRFQVSGTRDPEAGRRLAQELQPAVIFLDVMMQNIDGWEILSALRYEPTTSDIPVIICTVLPVKDLALALGADAFLQKPVTQEQFLHMLDRHVQPSH